MAARLVGTRWWKGFGRGVFPERREADERAGTQPGATRFAMPGCRLLYSGTTPAHRAELSTSPIAVSGVGITRA